MLDEKMLFTFKPVDYLKNLHTYAGLAELDITTKRIKKVLKIPAASFRAKGSFMTNFAQGLCVDNGFAYVGCWNFIVIVDLSDFTVVDSFSTPEMADVHSIFVDEENIYIVSTATECLLCFDKRNLKKKWIWGPNEKILSYGSIDILPSINLKFLRKIFNKSFLRKYIRTPKYKREETRYIHKTLSPYYRHHINNITKEGGYLYLNTKGWFNSSTSSIIRINKNTREASFFVKPGTFIGSHDGLFYKDRYYVTEADNNSIASVDLQGRNLKRYNLEPKGFFVRGLSIIDDCFFVGFTPLRSSSDSALIIIYDLTFSKKISEIKLPELCGLGEKVAIHTIVKI